VTVAEIPAPIVEPGTVLVRVAYSTISTGTELSGIKAGGAPLWRRAIRNPDKVAQVAKSVVSRGIGPTRNIVEARLNEFQPMGYSAAGTVMEVGDGVIDLRQGDRVACAGAGLANHAEVVRVPRNLVVPVPESLTLQDASTVTLGAIALQGVRRAEPTLGETFVVIGLGIIGQLTAQLLRANGCRVIGTDLDMHRVAAATELGMDIGIAPGETEIQDVVGLTDGIGADGVIITAAAPTDDIVSTAFRMCRKKGRVVLVGDVGLALNRSDFYEKELDFLISTSYGPGRYDRRYEEAGLDYPVGYVRWTENRNMAEYLRQLADGRVRVGPLISRTFPVTDSAEAYASLSGSETRPIAAVLAYPVADPAPSRVVMNPTSIPGRSGVVRVALVGAGGYAKAVHLPTIEAEPELLTLRAIVSRTGPNAVSAGQRYGATYATTEFERVLEDRDVDLVVIATRHDLHAPMTIAALEAGKHVLVEKPLALTQEELDRITSFFERPATSGAPILLTGFNRRFSPYARRLAEAFATRTSPMVMTYRMNAGYLPDDHWVHTAQGGGRNLGEASHIYDLFTFMTGARVASVQAASIDPGGRYLRADNFVATAKFEDGSVATLTYTALGSADHPKEQLEVFCEGRVAVLDDYRRLEIRGSKTPAFKTPQQDKGQREELKALAVAIRSGGPWPSPLWQQVQAMEIAFAVEPFLADEG
jgi:predicted dehydrogenase/threonine dehydrogenase-like Zn-dependent dehydrogenase